MSEPANISKYQLSKFRVENIKKDRIVFLIGRRGSGKTTGVKHILRLHSDIDIALVICGTPESSEQYKSIFPDTFIYAPYDESQLVAAIKLQQTRIFEYKIGKRKKKPYMLILTDDCLFGKPFKGKFIRNIFQNGRHWNLLFMNTMQYVIDLTPDLRGQIDYAFLYKTNNPQEREKLFNVFGGPFPSKEAFIQIHKQCTENFGCMVIDNTATTGKLEDAVFWFRPPQIDGFRVGSKAMWKYHEKHYDSNKALLSSIFGDNDLGEEKKKVGNNRKPTHIIQVIKKGDKKPRKQ